MTRLFIVESRPAIRLGLRMRLKLERDVTLVGEAGDGLTALAQAAVLRPDVILMDIEAAGGYGTDLVKTVCAASPTSAVVVLSLREDAATRRQALAAGAAAFVSKHECGDRLIQAIREAAAADVPRPAKRPHNDGRRPDGAQRTNRGSIDMIRKAFLTVLSIAIAAGPAQPAGAQAAARRVSFADLAVAVVQNNLQLRAAALDVAVAQAQLAQAQGARSPQVGVSGSYARSQQQSGQVFSFPNPFGPAPPVVTVTLPSPDPNIYAARLAIQYPLFTGGRVEAQTALAQASLRGAQATFNRTKQQAVHAAEQVYLQGLLAAENIAAARRALDAANESLRVAQVRFSTGAVAQFDVLQAEVAVANVEQTLVRAQTGAASARANLNAALNLPLDMSLDLVDTLTPRPVEGTLADAIARALRERPDLVAFQSQIAAAQAGIDVAASGGRPIVSLGAGYDLSNSNGQSSSITGNWSVSLGVTLSVFDGGITQAKIREAQFRLEQLKIREAQTRQQIELDVRQAWLALQQAAGELTAATKAVEQGREAARLAGVRYGAGVGTSLEVLSAQSTLAAAELSLASARFNQNAARTQLILATGSL